MTRRFPCLTSLLNLELFLESLYTRVGSNLLGLMVERSSHRVWTTWMRDARNIKDSAVNLQIGEWWSPLQRICQALLQLKREPVVLQCMPQCARGMGLFQLLNRTLEEEGITLH